MGAVCSLSVSLWMISVLWCVLVGKRYQHLKINNARYEFYTKEYNNVHCVDSYLIALCLIVFEGHAEQRELFLYSELES